MTEEEREELERLQLEELRYQHGEIRRQKAKRKLLLIELIAIGLLAITMFVALSVIPKITKTITVDTNNDGYFESKTVFTWQLDEYEKYMRK